jgi:hypothetical protein
MGRNISKRPILIRSWEEALRALRAGRRDFCLVFGILRASHAFELVAGKIEDSSMVDGSIRKYTRAQFESRFGQFMENGQLFAE